jgi:RNA polymerase sigma factor (sigma-70 family)
MECGMETCNKQKDNGLGWLFTTAKKLSPMLNKPYESGDLVGAGYVGLSNAEKSYNPSRASWPTYAIACIRYAMLREIFKLNRPLLPSTVMRESVTVVSREADWEDLLIGFSDWDKKLTLMLVKDGLTQSEVGRIVGLDQSTVSKHWSRISGRLREQYSYLVN